MSAQNATYNALINASSVMFDENNPYPLVEVELCTYREAQTHAAEVDSWIGIRTEQIEATLVDHQSEQELWIGLPTYALLTPYIEFRQILNIIDLKEDQTIIDCGAGYGRLGFVVDRHYPKSHFIGFEMVSERVAEAQRCFQLRECRSAQMICTNLDDETFELPEAEVYFIYDFSHRRAIDRLLNRLQEIAKKRKITVVARGRSSRDAIDLGRPWLSQVVEPEHYPNFSIYRS